ncbi:VOC family protein [Gracilibacillus oryzae]|uniref:VOC family protein n=1 Tax=Gracilibacillus oryzae TaxID=1672701 RepID=A0A7C8GQU0_9BACI|nr:VOC family protein [Gracilibacillus oryzae]KAB8126655.1 VOC family protein [Gracilibacillus oryzae]
MTSIKWDHTVHYVNDLEDAIEQFHEQGLTAFMGGSHKQWGTYNVLSYFDLCYIEFLGVEDRELAETIKEPNDVVRDSVKLLPEREELSRVALRTDDIEAVAKHLSKFNLELSPIMDGKRLDSQGNLIEWKMMTIAGDYQGLPYPFVIQWAGTDEKRRQKMIESGVIKKHPAGNVSIVEAVFDVRDPSAVSKHWQELFDFERAAESGVVSEKKLVVGNQSFLFRKGEENRMQQLVFNTDSESLKGKTIRIGQGEYIFS